MQTALKSEPLRMTYEQFRQWAAENALAEWVDGEVVVPMPPREPHQSIVGFLHFLLQAFLSLSGQGKVITAPFETFLPSRPSSREPDIIVVTAEKLQNLSEERFTGAPDLVVEVVSADSLHRDRVEKFLEYEREGVREYWLVDSRAGKESCSAFTLQEGSFVPLGADDEGWIESKVLPGLRIKVSWFTAGHLPDPLNALGEMLNAEMRQQIVQKLTGS